MGSESEILHLELLPTRDTIPVSVIRSLKRKNWSLVVKPGGEVVLSVPFLMSVSKVQALLKKHEEWIRKRYKKLRQLTRIDLSQPWVEGQSFYYQGQELRLSFTRAFYSHVSIEGGVLRVAARDFKSSTIKKVVEDWLEENSYEMASLYLQKWAPRFFLKEVPLLKLRLLKSSWGQCRNDGRITLHKFLSRLHPEFFEYVLVHELCHLFHMNHGPGFKALLSQHIPHWKELKKKHEPVFY
ncbi:MAG: YgjP-like metallopeptidase domain-containing protein [Bdellovibrionota bacterium]